MTAHSESVRLSAILSRSEPTIGAGWTESGDRECTQHGAYTSRGRALLGRTVWTRCPTCQADDVAKVEQARIADEAARVAAARAELLSSSCIPKRFLSRSFESFSPVGPDQQRALSVCKDFAGDFEAALSTGASLVLSGPVGTGKSHLAAAVMLQVLSPKRWAQYVTCMDMIRRVRATWSKGSDESEEDVLRVLGERVELLVIDEVGVQYGTDGEKTVLFDVLDRRYREMRPTILLTNLGREQFEEAVGQRVFDRLREVATWVRFSGDSYRPVARKAEAA